MKLGEKEKEKKVTSKKAEKKTRLIGSKGTRPGMWICGVRMESVE